MEPTLFCDGQAVVLQTAVIFALFWKSVSAHGIGENRIALKMEFQKYIYLVSSGGIGDMILNTKFLYIELWLWLCQSSKPASKLML